MPKTCVANRRCKLALQVDQCNITFRNEKNKNKRKLKLNNNKTKEKVNGWRWLRMISALPFEILQGKYDISNVWESKTKEVAVRRSVISSYQTTQYLKRVKYARKRKDIGFLFATAGRSVRFCGGLGRTAGVEAPACVGGAEHHNRRGQRSRWNPGSHITRAGQWVRVRHICRAPPSPSPSQPSPPLPSPSSPPSPSQPSPS